MRNYIYPKNMKSKLKIGYWQIKDLAVITIGGILALIIFTSTFRAEPLFFLGLYAVLTIVTKEDRTICSYITAAAKLFIFEQQAYKWKGKE